MSWSVYVQGATADKVEATLRQAVPAAVPSVVLDKGEVSEQVEAAIAAAAALASHVQHPGCCGNAEDAGCCTVNISLSGHANPSHEPTAGFANDMITVSVSNASPAANTH